MKKMLVAALLLQDPVQENLEGFRPAATRVSVSAEKRPLTEVVDELKKQGAKIRLGFSAKGEVVTLKLEDAPLLRALEGLCSAHGGLVMRWPRSAMSGGDATITLDRGKPGRIPRAIDDQVALELAWVAISQSSDFGADVREETRLQFHATWDRLKPMAARLRVTHLEDDQGNCYADRIAPSAPPGDAWRTAPQTYTIMVPHALPPETTAFKLVAGALELEFPGAFDVLSIDDPVGKKRVSRRSDGVSFNLVECSQTEKGVAAKLETYGTVDLRRREFRVVARDGRSWPAVFGNTNGDELKSSYLVTFAVPADAEVAELRYSHPKPGPVRKTEFRFENVGIR